MTKTHDRTALLILGMHRSGTSAFTRVMSMLGYALPVSVSGVGIGNKTGHWESAAIAGLSDSVLDELGLKWYSWSSLLIESLGSQRKAQIIEDFTNIIKSDFPGNRDFIMKDPRSCRLTSVQLPALKKIGATSKILIPIRNPLEVADSLEKRNGISKGQSILIWLRYVLDAEFGTRGCVRAFARYDELLESPVETVDKIVEQLNLTPNNSPSSVKKDITRFLDGGLKNNTHLRDEVYIHPLTKGWVSRVVDAFTALEEAPLSKDALRELDKVRLEFDNSEPLLLTILNTMHSDNAKKLNDAEALLAEKTEAIVEAESLAIKSQEALAQKEEAMKAALSEAENEKNLLVQNLQNSEEKLLQAKSAAEALLTEKAATIVEAESLAIKSQASLAQKEEAMKAALSEAENETNLLVQNLQNSEEKLLQAKDAAEALLAEKTAAIVEAESLAIKSQATLAQKEEAIKELESHAESLANDVSQETQKVAQLEGELSQITATLKLRGAELVDIKNSENDLRKEIKKLSLDEVFLQKKASTAEALTAKIVADLTDAREIINTLKHENELKRTSLEDEQRQNLTLTTSIKNMEVTNKELIKKIEAMEVTNKESAKKIEAMEAMLDTANVRGSATELERDDLRNKLEHKIEKTRLTEDRMNLERQGFQNEVQHLRERLNQEQRTILKPSIRRARSLVGKTLRTFLPNRLVSNLAFMVPTAEQKQILKMREVEKISSNIINPTEVLQKPKALQKPDIFVFAIIGWHFRMQRPQHIARELSKLGHRVFYFEMDPPNGQTEIEELAPNLMRVKLKLENTPQIQAYTGVPNSDQQKAWLVAFYNFCDSVKASPHKELIIQHPFWWQLAKLLPPQFRTFYDCMDDIAGFDNSTQALIDLEHEFLEGVDDLVVSSTTLFNKYTAFNPLDTIRNATELSHFKTPDLSALTDKYTVKPSHSKKAPKIKVGYVGAISDWFDTDLLLQVARARPDVEFHLCGNVSVEHPKALAKEHNITLYGEIPYVQAPAFLNQMDVLIIPFRIIPIIQACDPVKFYEYSALGKPTVSTPLPELNRASHLVFYADGAVEFSQQIDAAFKAKDDADFIEELQDFAEKNTWAHRAQQMSNTLDLYPKISVVILAYGNPALTNATLHSLMGEGLVYPNLDIIIVDNGSSPEAIENIRSYAAQFSNTRLIENGENLGFAAGNNVGINAATGEYVLLLNNDTYVSPGALYGMMRQLQKNPKAGVVGPLTNNIGNEAKMFVEYDTMDSMIRKARAFTTGYRGKSISTRVVAYFAVMFRKNDLDNFGMLSTDYGRGMFEDDDHCHKIRQDGFDCIVAEDAFVHHHLSATFSEIPSDERTALFDKNKTTFEKKWGPWEPHKYRDERDSSDLLFSNEELF